MPKTGEIGPIIAAEPLEAGDRVALNLYDGKAYRVVDGGTHDGIVTRSYAAGEHVTIMLDATMAPLDSRIVLD